MATIERTTERINADGTKEITKVIEMEWINIKDGLPDKDGRYIVYHAGIVEEAAFISGIWLKGYYNNRIYDVVFWMDMPDAPIK